MVGLTASVVAVTTLSVQRTVEQKIREELVAARQVFDEFQRVRFQQLLADTRMLAEVPQLKAVVTTPDLDHATFLDSARTAQQLIGSELLMLADREGRLLASVTEPDWYGEDMSDNPVFADTLRGESFQGVWIAEGNIYQVVAHPFAFGNEVAGVLVTGFAIDPDLIATIEMMTNCRVALMNPDVVVASLSAGDLFQRLRPMLLQAPAEQAAQVLTRVIDGERYLVLAAPFGKTGVSSVLAESMDQQLLPYRRLRTQLLVVAGLILAGALLLGLLYARRITQPISALVAGTTRIAAGDFDSRVEVVSTDELGELGSAFNQMIETLHTTTVSKDYVGSILQSMFDALVVMTPNMRIQTVNRAACDLLGYHEEELKGQPFQTLFARGTVPPSGVRIEELMATDEPVSGVESLCMSRSGKAISVALSRSVMRGPDGTVRGIIYTIRDITERKQAEEALRLANEHLNRLSREDTQTGVLNRRAWLESATIEWARARRNNRIFSITLIDLDHFKEINDRYGHPTGDEALKLVVGTAARMIRATDVLGRYGGDEFVLLLSETPLEGAQVQGQRFLEEVRRTPLQSGERTVHITLSLGVAAVRPEDQHLDDVLQRADAALYAAKQAGRDQLKVAESGPPPGQPAA